jgi:hypothetical protein
MSARAEEMIRRPEIRFAERLPHESEDDFEVRVMLRELVRLLLAWL